MNRLNEWLFIKQYKVNHSNKTTQSFVPYVFFLLLHIMFLHPIVV